MQHHPLLILLCSVTILGCAGKDVTRDGLLFTRIPANDTGIGFVNSIADDDSLNILTYEYLYNGGGVGVIDVNNDGMKDLFFTGNQSPNALYLNRGDLEFEEITNIAGVAAPGAWCNGVSIVDVNNDGYEDIYLCVGGPGNRSTWPNLLFINQGDMTFREEAAAYGLADPGESMQAVFFDYDKDSDLDMYLLTGGGFERPAVVVRPILKDGQSRNSDKLFENVFDSARMHPVFVDVSQKAGVTFEGFGLGVSVLDVNNDSWPDIFVSNDYLSRDLLYVNNGDKTFSEKALEYLRHTSHFSMGNDVADINNDGLPDIMTVDMLPDDHRRRKLMFGPDDYDKYMMAVRLGYGHQYMRNMLQVNNGRNGFKEIGQMAGVHRTDWSWGPVIADFDNDGLQDIFVTNGYGKDVTDLDFVKFRQTISNTLFADRQKLHQIFLDSLDARPAVVIPNCVFRNEGDLVFSSTASAWGLDDESISNGAVAVDLDNDGDLDIVTNNVNQEAFLYRNNSIGLNVGSGNWLRVQLGGYAGNKDAIGAEVVVYSGNEKYFRYQQRVHGFLSSSDNIIHFGVGKNRKVDSVLVKWGDGRVSIRRDVQTNQVLTVQADTGEWFQPDKQTLPLFQQSHAIAVRHSDTESNDFQNQPLLTHGFSRLGPGIAVGDVNGDGADDFFIGGGYGAPSVIMVQQPDGTFARRTLSSEVYEDIGAVFFDADSDGDLDLYTASGGSERYENHEAYRDRLYQNDGKGNFSLSSGKIPQILTSTSCVVAADFDRDGDEDLFVAGRVVPGKYPSTPRSFLLENRNGIFVDVTLERAGSLSNIGMVTSAVFSDIDNDLNPDLIVTGEFMPVHILRNTDGIFTDVTNAIGLGGTNGLWNSVLTGDFDNDGDMDIVAGNIGLNIPFRVRPDQPLELHYADFDGNGSIDPLLTAYENGVSYPVASMDRMIRQLPHLRKKFTYYRDYANATQEMLLKSVGMKAVHSLRCMIVESVFIENLGGSSFSITSLPRAAQVGPVNGMLAEDVNADGLLDLVLAGNMSNREVVNGRLDAGDGIVLINRGSNRFEPMSILESGWYVPGDARGIIRLETTDNKSLLVAANNGDLATVHEAIQFQGLSRVFVNNSEAYALVRLEGDITRKTEFPRGAGYLSQSSRSIVVTRQIQTIETFDIRGNRMRRIPFPSRMKELASKANSNKNQQ